MKTILAVSLLFLCACGEVAEPLNPVDASSATDGAPDADGSAPTDGSVGDAAVSTPVFTGSVTSFRLARANLGAAPSQCSAIASISYDRTTGALSTDGCGAGSSVPPASRVLAAAERDALEARLAVLESVAADPRNCPYDGLDYFLVAWDGGTTKEYSEWDVNCYGRPKVRGLQPLFDYLLGIGF